MHTHSCYSELVLFAHAWTLENDQLLSKAYSVASTQTRPTHPTHSCPPKPLIIPMNTKSNSRSSFLRDLLAFAREKVWSRNNFDPVTERLARAGTLRQFRAPVGCLLIHEEKCRCDKCDSPCESFKEPVCNSILASQDPGSPKYSWILFLVNIPLHASLNRVHWVR